MPISAAISLTSIMGRSSPMFRRTSFRFVVLKMWLSWIADSKPMQKDIAIKRFRFDPNDENIRQNILTVNADSPLPKPRAYNYLPRLQMLALLKDKWASLNHPNISPFWPLASATEPIPAVAMSWFGKGNVLDFIHQYPHVNRFNIVRLVSLARFFSSFLPRLSR
jgi:hypothetical protein